jgi:hypothetical protein
VFPPIQNSYLKRCLRKSCSIIKRTPHPSPLPYRLADASEHEAWYQQAQRQFISTSHQAAGLTTCTTHPHNVNTWPNSPRSSSVSLNTVLEMVPSCIILKCLFYFHSLVPIVILYYIWLLRVRISLYPVHTTKYNLKRMCDWLGRVQYLGWAEWTSELHYNLTLGC